jgi:hypothetical protein
MKVQIDAAFSGARQTKKRRVLKEKFRFGDSAGETLAINA